MNTEELKQKALAAIRGGETGSYVDFLNAREVFGQAANPATILALIAERDELLAKLDRAQAEIRALESKLLEREVQS